MGGGEGPHGGKAGPVGASGPSPEDEAAHHRLLEELARTGVVRSGPFEGLRLSTEVSWGGLTPYLLGSYECELHEPLERLLRTNYRQVVDIGCAEGYYAVGLARRLPGAEVIAFDIDPEARRLCAATADLNGVADRVEVHARCDAATLAGVLGDRSLVVVDCEGAEVDILRPDVVPALRGADLIVELHDFVDPTISSRLLERFSPTHDTEVVDVAGRDPQRYPMLRDQPGWVGFLATYEGRPSDPHPMQWAVMTSRSPTMPTSRPRARRWFGLPRRSGVSAAVRRRRLSG